MISVALVEPEIPPNTGNIARLCAATRTPLHIVGVTGFRLDDRAVRRAGLDYWPEVTVSRHRDVEELWRALPGARFLYLTTKAEVSYTDWRMIASSSGARRGDYLKTSCAPTGSAA
jgi:tRNA (cytidine/uridine-2'-O-)-methyltransferase